MDYFFIGGLFLQTHYMIFHILSQQNFKGFLTFLILNENSKYCI